MFNPGNFISKNQIRDKSKLTGEVVKRVWCENYESDLFLIFVSGKFAIFHAISGCDGSGAEIDFQPLLLESYDYHLLRDSNLVSKEEFHEWDTHKQKIDRDIKAHQQEINERTMLADLKRKYER